MNIIKIIGNFIISLSILIVVSSCNSREIRNPSANKSDTLLTKSITFPESLYLIQGGNFFDMSAADSVLSSRFKIISIVDGSCVKCIINQLNVLDSTFAVLVQDFDAKFITILNVNSRDSIYFLKFIYPEIEAQGTVLWDNNFNFERANALFTSDNNLKIFLVDESNQVIQYGNPLVNPGILDKYQSKLSSY